MRGFLYLRESESIVTQISSVAISYANGLLSQDTPINDIERKTADKVSKFLYKQTEKEPMILVKLLDVDAAKDLDPR